MMFHLARSVAFHAQQKEKLLNEKRLDVPGMRKYAGVVVSGYLTHEDKVAMNKLEKVLKCVFLLYTRIIVKHYIFFPNFVIFRIAVTEPEQLRQAEKYAAKSFLGRRKWIGLGGDAADIRTPAEILKRWPQMIVNPSLVSH